MPKIAVVTSSARRGRQSLNVARWVKEEADRRGDADYEIINISELELPVWDEATPPAMKRYGEKITKRWSTTIGRYDGFVFIASERHPSIPGALKNALNHLSPEFHDKAAGFVSYGSAGGAEAVEHLRATLSGMQMAYVHEPVAMSLFTDFRNDGDFAPTRSSGNRLHGMLDELLPRTRALESAREKVSA
ncbi:NAD(P)H-dependent oxidoreductase [Corynebacterium sp. YIM 101645]|uniref:NAD(P)H-dependent oxidoreductase n=1 Tax=Corynebacterium lemuris TaxID=1859292 RepID=A0ABT2FV56_9CORY|nr:NAD(P)H-dependent oxidoreductase [Corynebacterium lemuris]MCS5479123.1 NAD(P)H-dependent oxidoreductase [Corynebacterium lemuris]